MKISHESWFLKYIESRKARWSISPNVTRQKRPPIFEKTTKVTQVNNYCIYCKLSARWFSGIKTQTPISMSHPSQSRQNGFDGKNWKLLSQKITVKKFPRCRIFGNARTTIVCDWKQNIHLNRNRIIPLVVIPQLTSKWLKHQAICSFRMKWFAKLFICLLVLKKVKFITPQFFFQNWALFFLRNKK